MEFWKMNGAGNDFIIINNIKKVRVAIIRDPEASFRVRAACFLSYLGCDLTVYLLNKMKKHKYM